MKKEQEQGLRNCVETSIKGDTLEGTAKILNSKGVKVMEVRIETQTRILDSMREKWKVEELNELLEEFGNGVIEDLHAEGIRE